MPRIQSGYIMGGEYNDPGGKRPTATKNPGPPTPRANDQVTGFSAPESKVGERVQGTPEQWQGFDTPGSKMPRQVNAPREKL